MTDDHRPEITGPDVADDAGRLEVTRRQLTRWLEYVHLQEPALDNTRTNNVNQHFLTAFLGLHLKGDANLGYPDGIWKGFKMWSAVGMEMKHLRP